MEKLRLHSLTFVNPDTGKKTEVVLPEGFHLEFNQPLIDDESSAHFLAGSIFAGAYGSTQQFLSENDC